MDEQTSKIEELDPETGEVVFTMEDADGEDDVRFEDSLRYDDARIAEIMMKFECSSGCSGDYPRWRSGVPSVVIMGLSLIWLAIAMMIAKGNADASWVSVFAPLFVFLLATLTWLFITFRPEMLHK